MDETLTLPPSGTITPEEWCQTPVSVQNWIRNLVAEVKQLRETGKQLREIVNRNSPNSSPPPSQDRPEQKPAKEPSGPPCKRGKRRAAIAVVSSIVVMAYHVIEQSYAGIG